MGAWGYQAFQNDDAGDWAWSLVDQQGIGPIVNAFSKISDDVEVYVELPEASAALAAAEVVAALGSGPSSSLPENVVNWLKGKPRPSKDLIERACIVLDRIEENSELKDSWQEAEELFPQWTKTVEDLRSRLKSL